MDDTSWAEYCQMLDRLGLSEIVAVYQKAYSDYCDQFGIG